jgi:methanogenic corrinoid protein MtbC1
MDEKSGTGIDSNVFASELLELSAAGFAAQATDRMLDAHPDIRRAFAPGAHLSWRDNLQLRLRELAAAVAAGRPQMFTARVVWSWQSFAARGIERSALSHSLLALRGVLSEKLPENARTEPLLVLDQAQAVLAGPLPESATLLDAADPAQAVALSYLQTVLEGDTPAAIELVLAELASGRSAPSVICDVLLPAQAEIGRLWHLDQLSVPEEHLVSAATARLLALVADRAPRRAANGNSVLVSALPQDAHDIGIRALAYLLELDGWRVFFLGADVPQDELVRACAYFGVDLVLLSVSMSVQLRDLRRIIGEIREHAGIDARVMVGGHAFRESPEAWQDVGADAYAANVGDAVRTAENLLYQAP